MEHLSELLAIFCVFGIPLSAIWTHHKRKMMEIQLQLRNGSPMDGGVRAEVEALRQEMRSLRDTCTQYDLSFDTALQRMEQRVGDVERRVQAVQADDVQRVGVGR